MHSHFPGCLSHPHGLHFLVVCVLAIADLGKHGAGLWALAYFPKHSGLELDPFSWKRQRFLFFFLAKQLIVCICHIFFIQSSVASGLIPNLSYWELNYNKHGGTQNSHMLTSFHLGKFPGVRWLDHSLVDLFSCVWGVSILLSVTVVTLTFPPAVD